MRRPPSGTGVHRPRRQNRARYGLATIVNGRLLALAAEQFDAFVTVDRNLSFQQNLTAFSIAVVVLRARTNRLADLKPLVPKLLQVIAVAPSGVATMVEMD